MYPLSERASALRVSMISSLTRNNGAWGSKYVKLWRHIGRWRICIMHKLDKAKVEWIIDQKHKGTITNKITKTMKDSTIWIKKLWSRYRHTVGKISYQEPMGRPCNGLADHKEHSAIFSIRHKQRNGAVSLEKSIEF